MRREFFAALALAVLAGACGAAESAPLTVDGYVSEINEIVAEFEVSAEDAEKLADFPIEGELTGASALYMTYEASLVAMRSITPPAEIAAEHEQVVDSLAEVQEVVAEYLQKASTKGGFEFDSLNRDPDIAAKLAAFAAACLHLRSALQERGVTDLPDACGAR